MPQPAMAHGPHKMPQMFQFFQVRRRAVAARDFLDDFFLQLRSHAAGCAEAATFVCEEMDVILHGLQDIAPPPEYGECARGGQVFEGNAPPEFLPRNENAGGSADLYRIGSLRSAIVQNILYRRAERIFINPGLGAVTRDAENFASAGFSGARPGKMLASVQRDHGDEGEGLHVVHDGRLIEVAMRRRKRWAVARPSPPTLQGFDQRRLLSADICAGA